jgi:GNAT superfamily N-acetyltransferase
VTALHRVSLTVRQARTADIEAIIALTRRAYPDLSPYSPGQVQGQITAFPDGQFVAESQGEIVGYAATFRIDEASALGPHTWDEITGAGYASRHDPNGVWLYGMEVCVDPTWRGKRVGRRLYEARQQLAERLELKGVVFGGRLPGLSRKSKQWSTPGEYLSMVQGRKLRDRVATFQIDNGFEPLGLLAGYLPSDKESLGYASHMVWRNPYVDQNAAPVAPAQRTKDWVRVATVQFQQRAVKSFEEFISNIEYFVDISADYKADFVVFPELFTLTLLAFETRKLQPAEALETLTRYTQPFVESMREMAVSYNINIIGGSHPTRMPDGDIHNVAYVFLHGDDRPLPERPIHERQRPAGRLDRGQGVDQDATARPFDDAHVGQVVAAHLVDAVRHREEAVDAVQLRLTPEARVHARRGRARDEIVGRSVPDDPSRRILDAERVVRRDESPPRVVERRRLGEWERRRHGGVGAGRRGGRRHVPVGVGSRVARRRALRPPAGRQHDQHRDADAHAMHGVAHARSRSTRLSTLPVGLRGNSSMKRISRGTL